MMKKSTSTPSPGTDTVGPDFDDDIIAEILLRLPAKSLLCFRCVCKSWRALISDPSFVRNHLRRVNANNFNFLVVTRFLPKADVISKQDNDDGIAITEIDYPVTFSNTSCFMIHGSCNGLICAEFVEFEFENGNMMTNIIIWNPLTREFKQLPQPEPGTTHLEGDRYVALAGFGYDSTIEDYKVIQVTRVFDYDTTLEVFTFKTGTWRTNPDFNRIQLNDFFTLSQNPGFLLNETLHWVAKLRGSEYEEGTVGIVTIGLAEEKFQVMALLPFRDSSFGISSSIVMSGNSLLVYHEFSIWMMKEYGVQESWTEVVYISPEVLPQSFSSYFVPMCILDNGEVVLYNSEELGLYDSERKRFRSVIWNGEMTYPPHVSYVETLVSPQNDICGSEDDIASTVENKSSRMEDLSINVPIPSGWRKKGRRTKRGRWRQQRRSN